MFHNQGEEGTGGWKPRWCSWSELRASTWQDLIFVTQFSALLFPCNGKIALEAFENPAGSEQCEGGTSTLVMDWSWKESVQQESLHCVFPHGTTAALFLLISALMKTVHFLSWLVLSFQPWIPQPSVRRMYQELSFRFRRCIYYCPASQSSL